MNTSVTHIPFQPTTPNPKPTSNSQFPCAVVSFDLLRFGIKRRGRNECGEMELIRRKLSSSNSSRGCLGVCSSSKEGSRKVEVESVNGGGKDVFDAAAAEARVKPDHLIIMVNGIIGSSADWRYAGEQFVKNLPDKVVVHRSKCNPSRLTFDGVDRMGERLAEEVMDVIRRWHGVSKISFVAHSLGGLVARYAIGRLYQLSAKSSDISAPHDERLCVATIAGLEPMNFVTFATPHLGSRGHKQLPILCGLPFLEKSASQTAHWIAGRSGKHLFLTDNDDGRPPLLLRMVNDTDGHHFMSALRSFKRRVAYANANYDHVVGWRTSSIRRPDELPKQTHCVILPFILLQSNLLVNNVKYPHIVHIERGTTKDGSGQASSAVATQVIDLEEEMIRGLNQVCWERVDVSFHKSRQRYVAHNTIQVSLPLSDSYISIIMILNAIFTFKRKMFGFVLFSSSNLFLLRGTNVILQVKSYWLNSDGADVVQHMIDNFLL
ncbi:hypothetical protein BUALT_Bualt12G0064100 [Buddleja alternifolia]|uniref:DUF676 domain-containing protein n=1 Tax=Buddleja alternifolia TaxID=168488 RepID=A0AAV6WPJ1_9LAMI|nr:hypothetical protein BUALT_Bualt12G0064100 [Buddleja alternifolia]